MSKFTLKGILILVELLLSLLDRILVLIVKIADFVDDGLVNDSVVYPAWYRFIWQIQDGVSHLIDNARKLYDGLHEENSNEEE